MSKLIKRAIRYGRTDGQTDPIYRKALHLTRIGPMMVFGYLFLDSSIGMNFGGF